MRPFALAFLALIAAAPQDEDTVMKVLQDELGRSTKRLKMEKAAPPYYVGYTVKETLSFEVRAIFGALAGRGEGRNRALSADVRVGDYSLDNTNFTDGDMGMMMFGRGGGGSDSAFSVDDDY